MNQKVTKWTLKNLYMLFFLSWSVVKVNSFFFSDFYIKCTYGMTNWLLKGGGGGGGFRTKTSRLRNKLNTCQDPLVLKDVDRCQVYIFPH